ncbi:hypothetical protein [Avibacterium paragallinarum]|uniref:Uncharacterized protein n=1 Tax=Avibacterium paragallinarum TaxID=728 RepID=A0A377ICG1_AVIPA|nr:hypothetical protein [Avibacterium paragallinarum]STO72677.1 Uncharacterised protein [Avibacterium paragallinarum]STO73015.1 Uncharacterised protein [Avibacterium paragallinarum]SUV40779.1 Uncharacterised protein [Avibacterium paragallinarum]
MSNQKSSQSKPQPAPTKPTQTVYRKPEPVFIGDSADKPRPKGKPILG